MLTATPRKRNVNPLAHTFLARHIPASSVSPSARWTSRSPASEADEVAKRRMLLFIQKSNRTNGDGS